MPEGESFDTWLSAFSKEVDASLKGAGDAERATPEARHARDAFDRWWQSQQRSPLEATAPLELKPQPTPPPPEPRENAASAPPEDPWPSRVERLADDRARLQQERDAAQQQNREMLERLSSVQSQIAEFESRLSRSRQAYEEHIDGLKRQLEESLGQAKAGEERAASLAAAEQARKAAEERAAAAEQRAAAAESQLAAARERQSALERELSAVKEQLAAQGAVVEELRRQASTYQLRLVQSKESTDYDVASMRQELKTFLEDLRLIRNSMRKGE